MKNKQAPVKSGQWPLSLIYKIEAASDWLQEPQRKQLGNQLFGIFIVVFLLWGMFLVSGDILDGGGWPRDLVSGTVSVFPWVASVESRFGASAGKFVFWQSLSIWVLLIPLAVQSLAYKEMRLRKSYKGKKYFQVASNQLVVGLVFFFLPILLNTLVFQYGRQGLKYSSLLVLNNYFCVLGASMCAVLTVGMLIEILMAGIYLIHYELSIPSV